MDLDFALLRTASRVHRCGTKRAVRPGCGQMALDVDDVENGGRELREIIGRPGAHETLHLAFLSARRLMQILRLIVSPSSYAMALAVDRRLPTLVDRTKAAADFKLMPVPGIAILPQSLSLKASSSKTFIKGGLPSSPSSLQRATALS